MIYQQINRLVSREMKLPQCLSLPDILCYEALVKLKYEYEVMGLEAKAVKEKKQKVKKAYDQYQSAYHSYLNGMKEYQRNIKRSGRLRIEIIKEHDQTKKLKLALECIGAMTGDADFERLAGGAPV